MKMGKMSVEVFVITIKRRVRRRRGAAFRTETWEE